MQLNNYYWCFQGALPSRICDDIIEYGKQLKEETGVESVKLIKEIDNWLTYELPKNLLGKIWKGKYRGQKQKWFIMKFLGNEEEINIKTKNAEFKDWKWIDVNQLLNVVVSFNLDVQKYLVNELNILLD